MAVILEAGKYSAVTKGASPYYRPKSGKLSLAVACMVDAVEIIARVNVELNDGTISSANIATLRRVFPDWDGTIEGLLIAANFADKPCEIEVEVTTNETSGEQWSNVKWLNPVGGGGGGMPEPADPKDLLAKYGSKFRALAGGKPIPAAAPKAAAPVPAAKPPAPKPKAKAPSAAAATPTMESCWAEVCKNHPDPADASKYWEGVLENNAPGKEYTDITAEQWQKIAKDCEDNLPF